MTARSIPMNATRLVATGQLALVVVGVLFGWQEMKLAVMALFASSGDAPAALRLYILTGPLSVLPASILLTVSLRYGALWLLAGSLVSGAAWSAAVADAQQALAASARDVLYEHTVPMMGLGVAAVVLHVVQSRAARQAAESTPDEGDEPSIP